MSRRRPSLPMPYISESSVDRVLSHLLSVTHVPPSWAQKVRAPHKQSSEMPGDSHQRSRGEQSDPVNLHPHRRSTANASCRERSRKRRPGGHSSEPPMPFEERRHLHFRRQGQTPARDGRQQREDRTGTNVSDGHRSPTLVSCDDRRALGRCRRDDERNRKVNQQRVESTEEFHLRVETAPARELFPGIKRTGCVSTR